MLEIIGLILGLIGAISAIWYLSEKLFPIPRLSWQFVKKSANKIAIEMTADNFSPTLLNLAK